MSSNKKISSSSASTSQILKRNIQNENEKNSYNANEVLANIFDPKKKFNINSPSQLKQMTLKSKQTKNDYSIKEDEEKNIYLIESISKSLLYINKCNHKFIELNDIDKIKYLIKLIANENIKIRLGSIILLYFILKKNFQQLNEKIKEEILKNILNYLHISYESQEELYLVSSLNILSLYNSSYDYLIDSISLIAMFLTDFEYPLLQRASFICLINLGEYGLKTLINISIKEEYHEYQKYILNSLIKIPFIQKLCIIKSLYKEINTNDIKRKLEAFCALNRFYDKISYDNNILQELAYKLNDDKYKKYLIYICSILRCSGNQGIFYLIDTLEKSEDNKKREIICRILGYKIKKNPEYINIILDNDDIKSNNFIPIGKLWKYYGNMNPILYNNNNNYNINEDDLDSIEYIYNNINNKDNENNNFLLINTRDFLTNLQRLMKEKIDYNNIEIINKDEKMNILDELDFSILFNIDNNKEEFKLKLLDSINQNIDINIFKKYKNVFIDNINNIKYNEVKEEYYPIDTNIIKYLCYHLNDYDEKVRLSSAISLGLISKPEAELSIKEISKIIILEKNISVISAMLWALGRNISPSNIELIPLLIKYIQSEVWKIRRNALYALSKFKIIAAEQAIPHLIKILSDSSNNKILIAEVIISMGYLGEKKLLDILEKNEDNNDKLISAIIKSFSYVDLNSNYIDNIIQIMCQKLYESQSFQIKQNCLYSFRKIYKRLKKYNPKIHLDENNKYIYLKEKNIIPLFYEKLKDKEFQIQKYAIDCLLEFGPKGELIFIEGLLKDKSPIVRLNCAIGLCISGVHNLRTLINKGLFDNNKSVRINIQNAILHFFTKNDILKYYNEKGLLMSLKILLEEYLDKGKDISEKFLKFSENILKDIIYLINQ